MWMFLRGHFAWSCGVTLAATLAWRSVSEIWRADHRGRGRLTTYQKMSIAGAIAAVCMAIMLPGSVSSVPSLGRAVWSVWDPLLLFSIQGLWFLILMVMGRSDVTGARVHYHVHSDRV